MRWIPRFGKLLGGALGVGLALILITAAPAYALTPTAAHHQWTGTGVHLFAGATTVQTAPGLVAALSGAGVGVAAIPPGSLYVYSGAGGPVGSFRFPVTGGTLSLSPLGGTIDHRGGIRFTNQATGASLEVGDFEIVLSATPEITGEVNGNPAVRVPVFDLNLTSAHVVPLWGFGLYASDIGVTLDPVAAGALNQTLGTTLFAGGLTIGSASTFAFGYPS